jgi:hypothetical protein
MPLKKCSKDGKSGWKFGDQGACYTGRDGRKQAIKQGLAILGPEKFKEHMSKGKVFDDPSDSLTKDELTDIAAELKLSMSETVQLLLQEKNVKTSN